MEDVGERLRLYDKLGDLCCSLAAYTAAVKFYGEQVSGSDEVDERESPCCLERH